MAAIAAKAFGAQAFAADAFNVTGAPPPPPPPPGPATGLRTFASRTFAAWAFRSDVFNVAGAPPPPPPPPPEPPPPPPPPPPPVAAVVDFTRGGYMVPASTPSRGGQQRVRLFPNVPVEHRDYPTDENSGLVPKRKKRGLRDFGAGETAIVSSPVETAPKRPASRMSKFTPGKPDDD